MKKRIISLCLCAIMILGMIPMETIASLENVVPVPVEEELGEEELQEEELVEEPKEEGMTAEKLAELFQALPSATSITEETSEEEKANIMAQLEEVVAAFDEMLENNPEEAALFEENYGQLYLDAMELNDALTGNDAEQYRHYSYNSRGSNVTITVNNQNGSPVTGATVTVTDSSGNTYEVRAQGNGQYKFTKSGLNTSYTITVSHASYPTESATISRYDTSTTITLRASGDTSAPNWQRFNVYYISTGEIPDSYSGAGDPVNYGPSGNNTPLVSINVDINKLQDEKYEDVVVYERNKGNQWHFIPAGAPKSVEASKAFWEAVKECMDEESIQAFKDTGLFDHYILYVLKKQNSGSQHADGILDVVPPVYVLEFYDEGKYFGGAVTDSNSEFKKLSDVQKAYENRLGVSISWSSDGMTGVYLTSDNAYTVTLTQTNLDSARHIQGSDIPYMEVNSQYYLATFNCTVSEGASTYYTVKYTDGVSGETLFADQTSVVSVGESVPAFAGDPRDLYDGYSFDGWALEGGDGSILSAEEIAGMTVSGNMVFLAQWSRIPTTFEATVNVVLNDSYAVDIKTMMGNSNAALFVSKDGETFYPLENTAVGEYKAELPNGTYDTYYSVDGGTTYNQIDERNFVIASMAGGRKVKFNSVSYNLNGGTSNPAIPENNYYHAGTAVSVTSVVPYKADHVFAGWKSNSGTVHESGERLTDSIVSPYTLTAQWKKAIDVKVTVVINHGNDNTTTNDEVSFSLVEMRDGSTIHTGLSKALSEASHAGFTYNGDAAAKKITYSPSEVTFADLPDANYTVNCFKAGYEISVEKTVVDDVQHITLTLDYKPEMFVLNFDVQMHENAMGDKELWPQTVHVKAVRWNGTSWGVVPQHENTSAYVNLDKTTGKGSGQVNVPQYWPGFEDQAADYRVIVTEYIMPDGRMVAANKISEEKYDSANGIYEGVVSVENGGRIPTKPQPTTMKAAFYDAVDKVQDGTPTVTISVNSYSVTFKADTVTGALVQGNGSYVVPKQIKIPAFAGFNVTAPAEGYVFDGWYSKDGTSDGDWKTKIVAGTDINSDVTVFAKWKAPLTIEGAVAVAGSYIGEGGQTIAIYDHDRVDKVTIVLRKNGVDGNIKSMQVPVTYDGNLGTGAYRFENVPDDGGNYYIEVRSANYSGYFQNEPESLTTQKTDYDSYTKADNQAIPGTEEPLTATVNAYLKFDPASFDLQFQVDATAIGDASRPEKAEVLITYKDGRIVSAPSEWTVISQMIYGGDIIGITDGLGGGSTSVWNGFHDGATLYEYGMRLADIDGLGAYTGADLPYHVLYQDPAYFVAGGQSKILKATLIPNTYAIHYDLGIDDTAVTGMEDAPKEHTWSFDTAISVEPVRAGYEFQGWYENEQFTGEPVTKINAKVSEETTLYAKWIQVQDKVDLTVTIIHKAESGDGLAGNYDKDLHVQLTRSLKDSAYPYEDVVGKVQDYGKSHWHTEGDGAEEEIFTVKNIFTDLSSAYAYSLNVSLHDYVVTSKVVTPILDEESGITTYDVQVTLQFVPDLLYLTVNAKVADGIAEELWPVSAGVKVNCWYDHPDAEIGLAWNTITQHENTTLTITLDETGQGSVSYPVWQWFDKGEEIPYYYRMEVVSLHFKDGSVVTMTGGDERYVGGDYLADIETESCKKPEEPTGTELPGAYGKPESGRYDQQGTVTAVISTDIWDDETPDHMQAEVRFRSADESKGTVSGKLSQVFNLDLKDDGYEGNVKPEEVIRNAETGYEFSHWTNDQGTSVENPFVKQEVKGGKTYTYTAHWKPVTNLEYTVCYLDMDETPIKDSDTIDGQTFGSTILSADKIVDIDGFVYDHADPEQLVIGVDKDNNVITLYYAEDRNDDDIADYKQAFVNFRSADAKGTVSGNTSQVYTFSSDKGYKGTVDLEEVILTPAAGYKFDYWTDEAHEKVDDPFKSQKLEGGKSYTYTAYWTEREDYSYTVKYLNKKDSSPVAIEKVVENQTFNSLVTENAVPVDGYTVDGADSQSITLDAENKVIVFYYNVRKDLTLTVRHLEKGTGSELHPDTVVNNLEFGHEPKLSVLRASIPGYKYLETDPESIIIGTDNTKNVVTFYYEKESYPYRVEYYYDGAMDAACTETGSALYKAVIDSYTAKEKTGFTLDYVAGLPLTIDDYEPSNVIRVYYATDTNDNDVPDKYEATVTFKVFFGTWTSYGSSTLNHSEDIEATYPLYERNDNGKWVLRNNVTLGTVPQGKGIEGYDQQTGEWSHAISNTTPVTGDAVYTLDFNPNVYTITATVVNGGATVDGSEFTKVTVEHNKHGNTIIHFEPKDNSYVIDRVIVDGTEKKLEGDKKYTFDHTSNYDILVIYEKDEVGGENGGDKIPDKYQKKVIYRVVNGTWGKTENTEKVVYLTLKTGKNNDVNGKAKHDIPEDMQPATGYVSEGSKWDVEPPTEFNGTHEETYTYRYTNKQQIRIIIEVEGGTSYPVHSDTVYDYEDADHAIEFKANPGFVLDTAKIKVGDIGETDAWANLAWSETLADGTTKLVHDHTVNQHIQVKYAEDVQGGENGPDGTPDYKQVFIQFNSAENGSVSGAVNQTYKAEDYTSKPLTPASVTKTADPGYTFSHWTDRDGVKHNVDAIGAISVEGGETYTFTANWIPRSDLSYTVNYVDESGAEIKAPKIVNTATYGSKIAAAEERIDIENYAYIGADQEELTIGLSENVLTLTYGLDHWKDTTDNNDSETGGDDYPDSKQALVRFSSYDESQGAVSGKHVVQVFTITEGSSKVVVPAQVGINPAVGHVFSHWTEKGQTAEVAPYEPLTVTGNMIKEYVAHWAKRQDLNYTVNHLDLDGSVLADPVVVENQTFDQVIYSETHKQTIEGYVFDHAEADSITIGVGTNVINLYYAKDQNKDGKADYKQFFVYFVSDDEEMGQVTEETTQVFDLQKNHDGDYIGKVTPRRKGGENSSGVVVTANAGYVEDFWSRNGENTPVNPFAEMDAEGGTSVTFEVHFAADEDNTGYADKYEATVTYKVHQGFWNSANDKDDKTETFLLYEQNEDTGWTLISPAVTLGDRIPDVTSAVADGENGFMVPGHWGDKETVTDDPVSSTAVVDGAVYTYSFSERIPYTITVTVENGSFSVEDQEEESPITVKFGDNLTLDFDADQVEGKHYVLESVTVDGENKSLAEGEVYSFTDIRANHSITVVYGNDEWSDPERDRDPEEPGDGISDNFQIKVNYHASPEAFGSVSRAYEVHTIVDADGVPVKRGDVQLLGSVASAKPADDNGKAVFVNWTDSLTSNARRAVLGVVSTDALLKQELKDVSGSSEYHFYANFRYEMKLAAVYFVEHYRWSDSEKQYVLDDKATVMGRAYVGDEVTAQAMTYTGYTLNAAKSTAKGIVTEPVMDPSTLKPTNMLVLKLYYDVQVQQEEPEVPANPGNSTINNVKAPGTGDTSNRTVWFALAGACLIGLLGAVYGQKKKKL